MQTILLELVKYAQDMSSTSFHLCVNVMITTKWRDGLEHTVCAQRDNNKNSCCKLLTISLVMTFIFPTISFSLKCIINKWIFLPNTNRQYKLYYEKDSFFYRISLLCLGNVLLSLIINSLKCQKEWMWVTVIISSSKMRKGVMEKWMV